MPSSGIIHKHVSSLFFGEKLEEDKHAVKNERKDRKGTVKVVENVGEVGGKMQKSVEHFIGIYVSGRGKVHSFENCLLIITTQQYKLQT